MKKLSSKFAWLRVRYWNRRQCRDHAKHWEDLAREAEQREKAERQSKIVRKIK